MTQRTDALSQVVTKISVVMIISDSTCACTKVFNRARTSTRPTLVMCGECITETYGLGQRLFSTTFFVLFSVPCSTMPQTMVMPALMIYVLSLLYSSLGFFLRGLSLDNRLCWALSSSCDAFAIAKSSGTSSLRSSHVGIADEIECRSSRSCVTTLFPVDVPSPTHDVQMPRLSYRDAKKTATYCAMFMICQLIDCMSYHSIHPQPIISWTLYVMPLPYFSFFSAQSNELLYFIYNHTLASHSIL